MNEVATAYLVPPHSASRPGIPGTKLLFRAGALTLRDVRQVPAVLRMADVVFTPTARYAGQVDAWIAACGEAKPAQARIALPDGQLLTPPDYQASAPAPEAPAGASLSPLADAAAAPSAAEPACALCASGKLKGAARRTHAFQAHHQGA